MWVRGEIEKDAAGKTVGLWGAAQDITQHKFTEEELKIAKEKPEVELKGMTLSSRKSLHVHDATILTDKEKLQAILFNLVKNAVKYTKTGSIEFGYVPFDLKAIDSQASSKILKDNEVGERSRTPELQFYVKDTGIGISVDRQKAIFERFIQADIPDKNAYQSSGLGLSISKAYVEMLGGRIWVNSEEGTGSTFYFTIPYHCGMQEKDKFNHQMKASAMPGQTYPESLKLKILIAEDDETSAFFLSEATQAIRNEMLKATNGIQAIDYCRNNPDIDLVLMDIRMPGIDGYEAIHQIRQFNTEVVIIAQTAHGLCGDREKSIAAGANDYISKPINKEDY